MNGRAIEILIVVPYDVERGDTADGPRPARPPGARLPGPAAGRRAGRSTIPRSPLPPAPEAGDGGRDRRPDRPGGGARRPARGTLARGPLRRLPGQPGGRWPACSGAGATSPSSGSTPTATSTRRRPRRAATGTAWRWRRSAASACRRSARRSACVPSTPSRAIHLAGRAFDPLEPGNFDRLGLVRVPPDRIASEETRERLRRCVGGPFALSARGSGRARSAGRARRGLPRAGRRAPRGPPGLPRRAPAGRRDDLLRAELRSRQPGGGGADGGRLRPARRSLRSLKRKTAGVSPAASRTGPRTARRPPSRIRPGTA